MKQGMRAMAGAVALVGLLATAGARGGQGPRDRGRRRVEDQRGSPRRDPRRTCRTGASASAAADRALAGAGARRRRQAAEAPQSNALLVHGPVLGRPARAGRATTRP